MEKENNENNENKAAVRTIYEISRTVQSLMYFYLIWEVVLCVVTLFEMIATANFDIIVSRERAIVVGIFVSLCFILKKCKKFVRDKKIHEEDVADIGVMAAELTFWTEVVAGRVSCWMQQLDFMNAWDWGIFVALLLASFVKDDCANSLGTGKNSDIFS